MLTIISVVEDNSLGLTDLMIKSVNKFTSEPHEIIIIDNAGTNANLALYEGVRVIDNTEAVKGLKGGSNRHGCGLNTGMKYVSGDRIAILDNDTVILSDNWCKGIRFILKDDDILIPHMCFLVLNAEAKNVDWSPYKYSMFSYPKLLDVGCNWKGKGRKGIVNRTILVDCKLGAKHFRGIQCDEIWDFETSTELLATHFGRGSNLAGKAQTKLGSHIEQLERWKAIIKKLTGLS